MRDVAKAAGVSVSTVSRLLDDQRRRSATAVRVREVADRPGYRRNTFASNLRRGATATIGVLDPRLSDTVMALMFEAIGRAADKQGYYAIVATCGDDPTDEWNFAESLLGRNVDGVILATSRNEDPLPSHLRDNGVPHVLVLRTDGESPSSIGDDETGGYLALRHLIDLGHTDIAVLSGPLFTSSAVGRLTGARRAFTEAGLEPDANWIIETGYGIEAGAAAGQQLFQSRRRPTAVFAANDNLALGVLSAAHRHQLSESAKTSPWSATTTFRSRSCSQFHLHRCAPHSTRSQAPQWNFSSVKVAAPLPSEERYHAHTPAVLWPPPLTIKRHLAHRIGHGVYVGRGPGGIGQPRPASLLTSCSSGEQVAAMSSARLVRRS